MQGGYQQFNEAQALLKQNQQVGRNNLDDTRVQALVLATRSAYRREAIQLFDSLGTPTNSERFLLAQLHEASGQWQKAEEQYHVLLQGGAKNPVVLALSPRPLKPEQ